MAVNSFFYNLSNFMVKQMRDGTPTRALISMCSLAPHVKVGLRFTTGVGMNKVIVFFNLGPAEVMTVMQGVTLIKKTYPNDEETSLQIMTAGFLSLTGDSVLVHVASDRTLSIEEIREAASKLL